MSTHLPAGLPVDHLPLPRVRAYDPPPLYLHSDVIEYDYGPFLTYHERMKWTEEWVLEPEKSGKSKTEIRKFFHNWFFFGFLSSVLDKPIQASDFITYDKDNRPLLTTKMLAKLFNEWVFHYYFRPHEAQGKQAHGVNSIFKYMKNVLDHWLYLKTSPLETWEELYLLILCQYIGEGYRETYAGLEKVEKFRWVRTWPPMGMDLLGEKMLQKQWCKSDVKRLQSTTMQYGVFFASLLPAPSYEPVVSISIPETFSDNIKFNDKGKDISTQTEHHNQHRKCSKVTCYAGQWKKADYTTRHVSNSCSCTILEVDMKGVIYSLENNMIPVILLRDDRLVVSPVKDGVKYIAISHVWSDGLGNPQANAMPLCQIDRIQSLVNDLYHDESESVHFWIDTLCCPVSPYAERFKAIQLMRKTYEEADKVLVLDAYLQSQSVENISEMEIRMMIHCSRWNRRLWTLQERILARSNLVFRFNNRTLSFSEMQALDISPGAAHIIIPSLANLPVTFSGLRNWAEDESEFEEMTTNSVEWRMVMLQRVLLFRATTKPSDEAICVGNILNLDTEKILDGPRDAKSMMRRFWSLIPGIPNSIIFRVGPKLDENGFRWAPSTLLLGGGLTGHHGVVSAALTQEGLSVSYPGWTLDIPPKWKKLTRFFTFIDNHDSAYSVCCIDNGTCDSYPQDELFEPWSSTSSSIDQAKLFIISNASDIDQPEYRQSDQFLLVAGYRWQGNKIYTRSLCPVCITKEENDSPHIKRCLDRRQMCSDHSEPKWQPWCSRLERVGGEGPDIYVVMGAERLPLEQHWIVD